MTPRTIGGAGEGDPTKGENKQRKYKYKDKEAALAARRTRRNRARKERRRRARKHLMATGRVLEAQRIVQRGSSKEQKQKVRHRFARNVQRTKQQRRRRQAVNRRIWQGAARDYAKARGSGDSRCAARQRGTGRSQCTSHWWTIQRYETPTQPWVAVGSSTTDCAPKVGRSEDDGVLLKIKIQIQGKVYVALVDSGASRNYASPEAVVDWELPGTPDVVHLELADGSKFVQLRRFRVSCARQAKSAVMRILQ